MTWPGLTCQPILTRCNMTVCLHLDPKSLQHHLGEGYRGASPVQHMGGPSTRRAYDHLLAVGYGRVGRLPWSLHHRRTGY